MLFQGSSLPWLSYSFTSSHPSGHSAFTVRSGLKLAFANQQDYAGFGPDGVRLRTSDDLTRDQMAAIAEVREVRTGRHKTFQLKLHDKKGALDSLARWAGIEKMPKPPDEPLRIEIIGDMPFSEIRKRRQK